MRILILDQAIYDLENFFCFYERQQEGVGSYFLNSIYSDIESLKLYAGAHPVFFGEYYRALSKRFPFAIYYRQSKNVIFVEAIFDYRQDPQKIEKKLK